MKKLSKKMVFFIGIILVVIVGLSLYLLNTPKEVTRMEELEILEAEKDKPIPAKTGKNDNTIIGNEEDSFFENKLIPLINDVIDYEDISYNDETGYVFIHISPETLSEYGSNEDMWKELANKLTIVLIKNEKENPNKIKYEIKIKEINKNTKVFLTVKSNGEINGDYIPIPIDEDIYLEKRVIFERNMNESLNSVGKNLEISSYYTDELEKSIKSVGKLIGDYLLENTPTEKYSESEEILRNALTFYSKVRYELPIAMQDKDYEKINKLQETMDYGNKNLALAIYMRESEMKEE